MLYESIKLVYLHFAYIDQCKDYAYLLWVDIAENLIFAIIGYLGSKAIVSRVSESITTYLRCLVGFIIVRVVTYYFMNAWMKSIILEEDENEWQCNAVYEGGLYVINAALEGLLVLFLLYFGR